MNNTTTDKSQEARTRLKYHFIVILVLFIIVYYLLDTATDEEILDITSLLEMRDQDYDYFMADVDSIYYTATGQADYRFQASRITHYPNPEYSLMESPQLMIYQEDTSPWSVNSMAGRIEMDVDRNQERLILSENVIINGVSTDGRIVNIYTDSLTIYPEEKNMHSESDSVFESDGFTSSSKGFTADMKTNVIRQLANGQFQYDN